MTMASHLQNKEHSGMPRDAFRKHLNILLAGNPPSATQQSIRSDVPPTAVISRNNKLKITTANILNFFKPKPRYDISPDHIQGTDFRQRLNALLSGRLVLKPQTASKSNSELIIEEEEDEVCPICMVDERNAVIKPCGHKICSGCAELWRRESTTCPYCRGFISEVV